MKRIALIGIFGFICSCTIIGKDTSLISNSSLWEPSKYQRGKVASYGYKCQESYLVEVERIQLENKVYSMGPIIPFIPIMSTFKPRNINIKISVYGNIDPIRESIEKANIYISNNKSNFVKVDKVVTVPTVDGFSHIEFKLPKWAVISINYPINEQLPEYIGMHTDLSINGCKIPDIEFKKEVKNYTDVTLHMGP